MESCGKIKVRLTLLVSLTDRTKSPEDPRYFKILLDNEKPLSMDLETINDDEDLKILTEKYLKYDFGFIEKILAGTRCVGENILELVYVTKLSYLPGLNKSGTIYTLKELQDRNIIIDEYYERALRRFGTTY
jgi:hypothetical protein